MNSVALHRGPRILGGREDMVPLVGRGHPHQLRRGGLPEGTAPDLRARGATNARAAEAPVRAGLQQALDTFSQRIRVQTL